MKSVSSILGAVSVVVTLFEPAAAINVDCEHVREGGVSWDLSKLNGEHTLVDYVYLPDQKSQNKNISRTTITFNPCQKLKREDEKTRKCDDGTWVCGVEESIDEDDLDGNGEKDIKGDPYIHEIAGSYTFGTGKKLDPDWTRLKSSPSVSDRDKEGLRLEMYGQSDPHDKRTRYKAIIDFICSEKDKQKAIKARADNEKGDEDRDDDNDDDNSGDEDSDGGDESFYKDHKDLRAERTTEDGVGGKIKLHSWGGIVPGKKNRNYRVLQLDWDTPFACETAFDDPDLHDDAEGGWGFFSWLFFLSFIGILAYFSFFAWINYTRFGKSGFDMLPHADTLRELPQLLGEYAGKIVNTLRGGHASGGYSAL